VLAVQGDEVPAEDHVVADEHRQSRADLDGHRAVVGGAQAQGRHAVRRVLVRQLQDSEEGRAVPAQRELLVSNGDLVQPQDVFENVDEFDVRHRLEGAGRFRGFDKSQLLAGDEVRVDVGNELTVLHGFLLCITG
jgi:hypothetical protein